MRFRKKDIDKDFMAYIGAGLEIEGNIVFRGSVKFEGRLKGHINGDKIIIGDTGNIEGEIDAEEVVCFGAIKGQVRVKALHLKKTARFKGDLLAEKFSVEEGAKIEGQVKVGEVQTQPLEDEKAIS